MITSKKIMSGYKLSGKRPGTTSVIIAGIHGNEPCGMNAFETLLATLKIDAGSVYFIQGNPEAAKKNVRFIEYNLNRLFRPAKYFSSKIKQSYEFKRSRELMKILDICDASLDIHSTLNESEPFIICEENGLDIVSSFPKDFVRIVRGFGDVEQGATDDYMNAKNKIGITVECGSHNHKRAGIIAQKAIMGFLASRGHVILKKKLPVISREMVMMDSLYYSETDSFILSRVFTDFEEVPKNTLIGIDGNKKIKTSKKCLVVFAHDRHKKGAEAFLLGHKIT